MAVQRSEMHLVVDGRIWENDSFSVVNKNLAAALHRLGYDVRLEAWEQGRDKPHRSTFLDRGLLDELSALPKDYDSAVVIRQSWPRCDPYYSPHYNWDNIPGQIKIGLLPWESDHVPSRWLENMARVDAVLAISPWSAAKLTNELRAHNVQTLVWGIPLGVDRRLFNPTCAPRWPAPSAEFRFLHVGVGQMRKGSDILRQAYFEEFTANDNVALFVKTGGWDSVEAWKSPGPRVHVIHDDNIPETEMGGLYTASHALVHPSRFEGFGMTMLEAMSCGTLVICPEQGAHRVFANETNSLLVFGRNEQVDFFEDLKTTAYTVDVADLRRTMRDAVNERPWDDKAFPALKTAQQFSWAAHAAQVVEHIENHFNVELRRL